MHTSQYTFKMVSVDKWKEHFRLQARHLFPKVDRMFVVNQEECGLGRKHPWYKIRRSSGPNLSLQIVSPVVQSIKRASYMLKDKGASGGRVKKKCTIPFPVIVL